MTYYIFLDTVSVGPAPSPNGFLLFSLLPAHDGLFYLVTFQEGTSFVSVCVRVCACVSLNLFVSRHFSTCVCVCVCVCVVLFFPISLQNCIASFIVDPFSIVSSSKSDVWKFAVPRPSSFHIAPPPCPAPSAPPRPVSFEWIQLFDFPLDCTGFRLVRPRCLGFLLVSLDSAELPWVSPSFCVVFLNNNNSNNNSNKKKAEFCTKWGSRKGGGWGGGWVVGSPIRGKKTEPKAKTEPDKKKNNWKWIGPFARSFLTHGDGFLLPPSICFAPRWRLVRLNNNNSNNNNNNKKILVITRWFRVSCPPNSVFVRFLL